MVAGIGPKVNRNGYVFLFWLMFEGSMELGES
jgi:hypothetical protein